MCLQNSKLTRRKQVTAWKVFRHHSNNKLSSIYWNRGTRYEFGKGYISKLLEKDSYPQSIEGYHAFLTKQDAVDYKRGGSRIWLKLVVVKVVLTGKIYKGIQDDKPAVSGTRMKIIGEPLLS